MKFFKDFRFGFMAPFQGIRFLFQHASLLKLAAIPLLINLLLFIAMATLLYTHFGYFLSLVITRPDSWYWLILYYALAGLAFILILVIGTFVLCLLGNLIAAPFHEWMCEKTKSLLIGHPEKTSSPPLWQETKRILSTQCKKLLLLLILEIGALLLVLIPGIGPFLSGLITLILLAFQFLDFPLGVERLVFSSQLKNFFTHPLAWLGFGCGISLMLAIPLANIAVLPSGVIGASLLYYQHIHQ
ncbi:MAG: EI24 domain-containing protein [Deltaproteobacteria bacterium]|nr:EI24 domain-containing protein [Deltaproteobacteria bacterium]MBI3016905.1 EI24 domain-containing protein [Deltaproteobacteria bacterium]